MVHAVTTCPLTSLAGVRSAGKLSRCPRRNTCMHTIRFAGWVGALTCLLIATLWLLTIPTIGRFRIEVHRVGNRSIVSLSEGCLTFSRNAFATSQPGRWYAACVTGRPFNPPPMVYGFWRPFIRTDPRAQLVMLPLWLALLMTAVPTALLWFVDRRRATPGCCGSCGYNLTGNAFGRCPECGLPWQNNSTTHDAGGGAFECRF